MTGVTDWGRSPRVCRVGRLCLWIIVIIVGSFTARVMYLATTTTTPNAQRSTSNVEPQTFERFLAALADKESGGDPNAVCDLPCACVGLYQITEQYVDDLNEFAGLKWQFSYDDRLVPIRAAMMVTLYLNHYVIGRLVDYDWSTLARVHHGGPDGWDEEYTKGFGEDVVQRMRTMKSMKEMKKRI